MQDGGAPVVMSIAQEKLEQIRAQVQSHLEGRPSPALTEARREALESTTRGHLSKQG